MAYMTYAMKYYVYSAPQNTYTYLPITVVLIIIYLLMDKYL